MKKKNIIWNENGWTVIQNADSEKHTLEVTALAKENKVVEVRIRHNDGEEVVLNKTLDEAHNLPMDFDAFKKAISNDEIKFK